MSNSIVFLEDQVVTLPVRRKPASQSMVFHGGPSRSVLTVRSLPSAYALLMTPFVFAAGNTDGQQRFVSSGKEIVIVQNVGATPHRVTIRSAPDTTFGRYGDMVTDIVPSGIYASQQLLKAGWMQSDGYVWIDVDSSELQLAVVTVTYT